jgi:hypothetical protein
LRAGALARAGGGDRQPATAAPPPAGVIAPWALPLALETAAMAGLAIAGDPTRRPLLTLALLAVASLGMVGAVRGAARRPISAGALLAVAALLRLLLVPIPPALSTDVWRYLWDGRVVLLRENPYLRAPDDPALAGARDELWRRVQHRDVAAVYPPLATALFVLPAALPLDLAVPAWKLLVALADVGACALLLRLAAERGWPRHRVLWYAAQPLVVLEGAGMGHLEPFGVAAAVATVLLLGRRQVAAAGVAAAAAGLVKLVPFAALPMWARQAAAGDRRRTEGAAGDAPRAPWIGAARSGATAVAPLLVAALGLAAVALLPMLLAVRGVPAGLVTYALRWEFGGPLHEPLWRLLAAADAPEAVKHGLDLMKERTGKHAFWNRAYPWAYPQLLSRFLLAGVALVVVARSALSRRPVWRDPVRGGAALFGGLLVCSPTVYPWYLLWVLPWAALAGRAPWLWAALAAPLLYLPMLVAVPLWPWAHLGLWVPFCALRVVERWRARR